MDVNLDYIGVGVNRVVNALAWGNHGGVAYAAHHMIALYDIESAKVVSTIRGHIGMVNCVHWVPREATPDLLPSQNLLLSGSADNTVCCWLVTYPGPHDGLQASERAASPSPSPSAAKSPPSWRRLAVLKGHTAPVTSVAIHRLPEPSRCSSTVVATASAAQDDANGNGGGAAPSYSYSEPRLLLVSTAGDSDVLVWACGGGDGSGSGPQESSSSSAHVNGNGDGSSNSKRGDGGEAAGRAPGRGGAGPAEDLYGQSQWRLDQRIHVGTKMQTTAAMTHLPLDPDWTLLATGGTDRNIHLYLRPPPAPAPLRPPGGPPGTSPLAGTCVPRFIPVCVLEGHENWVRGVTFCCVEEEEGGGGPQLLLASVSQDRYGRIWKLQPEPLLHGDGGYVGGGGNDTAIAANMARVPFSLPGSGFGSDPLTALIQRYAPKPRVDTHKTRYVATCEALLIGHEDWVHGLQWAPTPPPPPPPPTTTTTAEGEGEANQQVQQRRRGVVHHTRSSTALLTASMDRTMIIWKFQSSSGLWMNEASLGDAGASCLGYFGGVWGPTTHRGGAAILAHGFTGALHLWQQPQPTTSTTSNHLITGRAWLPRHALGGHFGAVVDVGWGLDGGCLISVSEDQTARVHSEVVWRRQKGGGVDGGGDGDGGGDRGGGVLLHWCEVARAQIHGHDFRCVAAVPTPSGSHYVYVSGSEEKVLRVLEAPQAFIDTLVALRGGEDSPGGRAIRTEGRRGHGFGAAIAALGLSNKAVDESQAAEGGNAGVGSGTGGGGDYTDGPDTVPCAAPQVVSEPPLEEHLAQNTLWPETHKLYGHGNDVFCAAASPDGRYLASACKAQTASTAAVWVWCTRSWRSLAQLRAHSLTVTQLEWSPTGNFLAAASRDRTFSVFRRCQPGHGQRQQEGEGEESEVSFELVCRVKGAHGRVIWSVGWSLDEQLLATASRDETVKVWRWPPGGGDGTAEMTPTLAATLPQFPCAATAVAFAPRRGSSAAGPADAATAYLLAVGLEDGSVQLWRLLATAVAGASDGEGPCGIVALFLWSAGEPWRHVASVRRLRWRDAPGTTTAVPAGDEAATAAATPAVTEGVELQLASGSEDHSVRVFTIRGGI